MTTADAGPWADVSVTEIRRTDDENVSRRKYVMTLQERGSERRVPIWICPAGAAALALAAGVPIRLDSDLFSLDHHLEEVASYPVATADLAAEARQRIHPGR